MKIISRFLVLTLMVGTVSFAAADKPFYPYSKKAGDSYKNLPNVEKGGTLYTRLPGNPRVLIPIMTADIESTNVIQLIYARLMGYDYDTDQFFPALAEKMETTSDFKTITYTLRKDATWEDGTPVTSDDAEFTYKVLMDPTADSAPLRANFNGYHFEKIDSLNFRFKIDQPDINTLFKINDNFKFLQKKQFENEKDITKSKGVFAPIGSGPYKLKSYSRDQKVELERNKNWWGWKIPQYKNIYNFDAITFRIIPDSALSYEKFVKGEIDVLELNSEIYGTRVKGVDKDKFDSKPNAGKEMWANFHRTSMPPLMTYVGWNLRNPVFKSKKTRQALGHLINYDQIISQVYHNVPVRCVTPFGSLTENTTPQMRANAYKFNVPLAISLLKEDGWSDADGDGVLTKKIEGKETRFEFTITYNSENPMRSKVAQMIKEQFKKAGIVVNVRAMEWIAYVKEIDHHNCDAFIMGWGKGYVQSDPRQVWHSTSIDDKGSNYVSYNNPEIDKLIDQANAELNPKKRFKVMQKIGAILYDDQPFAFISEMPGFIAAYHSKLHAARWVMKYDDSPPFWLYSVGH